MDELAVSVHGFLGGGGVVSWLGLGPQTKQRKKKTKKKGVEYAWLSGEGGGGMS